MNNTEISSWNAAESFRRTDLNCRIGKIVEARYQMTGYPGNEKPNWTNEDQNGNFRTPLYRVEMSDNQKIYWMPALAARAGRDQSYWAYEIGEQVAVLCPSGDPMRSIIIGAFYQNNHRPPIGWDDETVDKRPWRETVRRDRFADETLFEYDRQLHRFLAVFQNAADSYFEYNAETDTRKLKIHCKDIQTLTDYNTQIDADNDIKSHAKNEIYIRTDNNLEIQVANDQNSKIGQNLTIQVGQNINQMAGAKIEISAGTDIVLTAQTIELNAPNVVINGNLKVNGDINAQNITGQTIFASIASDNLHAHPL